jgi:GDPmannose 4,6-dehydratase
MSKKALVSGVTGQVGSYLAEYLLDKGYEVHGLDRRKSSDNHENIKSIKDKIKLHEGDITDTHCIYSLIDKEKYDEIYNLAAMSHVGSSFEEPQTTIDINTIGVLNLLEAIKKSSSHTRFYQASTSEMFGSSKPPQNENTIFHPRSPYGVSKLAAHWLVTNYQESYNLRAACGIMFNSESNRRGKNFVTRKITEWVKEYSKNQNCHILELGNLNSFRDWIHVSDSVEAIYRICNQDMYFNGIHNNQWKSYCFGSGQTNTVRYFLQRALELFFNCCFEDRFGFKGEGINQVLYDSERDNKIIMKINPKFYRPSEVDVLQCDYSLIKKELNWEPTKSLDDIIKSMLGELN